MASKINKACYVGFDTSNYTTSMAACDGDGKIIANIKIPLRVRDGERGLRQSDAVFLHVKNLADIFDPFENLTREHAEKISVAASDRPRDVEGSYMPCFLVGAAACRSYASSTNIPKYFFSHQDGHIMAALYSATNGDEARMEKMLSDGFAAFHVSGGTTELLLAKTEDEHFAVSKIGGTADLNAGQAIDRTGVAMGLKFPCGQEMEQLALKNTLPVPKPKISVKGLECCLSGLENLSLKLYKETENRECVSAFVLEYVAAVLMKMTDNLREQFPDISVVYAGGVMSNSIIQSRLSSRDNVYFASPEYSADNAAGIALLCRRRHLKTINERTEGS